MADPLDKTLKAATIDECIARAAELASGSPPDQRPVWLLTAAELMDELGKRAAAIVIGIQLPDDKNTVNTLTAFGGNTASCVGLADALLDQARMRMCPKLIVADRDEPDAPDGGCPFGDNGDGDEDDDDDEPDYRKAGKPA